jgi:undecaprenyl-diphosphatase
MFTRVYQFIRKVVTKDMTVMATMLIIVGGTLGFIELFDEVREGDTESFDHFVMEYVGAHRGPDWLPDVVRDLTALGAGSVLTLATAAVLGFLILRRQYHAFWFVLLAVVGGYLLSANLKEVIGRERPAIFDHGETVSSMSFPSGHAMMSAVVYLTLGGLLVRLVKERLLKIYILALASCATVIVGLTRIYMGVHWPTDVLAGWTAGLVWALICSLVEGQLQRRGVVEGSKTVAGA